MGSNKRTAFPQTHSHSDHSIKDGVSSISQYTDKINELGGTSLTLTEHGSASGYASQYFACKKAGIKPIYGMECYVQPNRKSGIRDEIAALRARLKKDKKNAGSIKAEIERKTQWLKANFRPSKHSIVLAKTREGYSNLVRMSTDSWKNGYYYFPRTDFEFLADHAEGLVYSTACIGGHIPTIARRNFDEGVAEARRIRRMFADGFYVEIMMTEYPEQRHTNIMMMKLAKKLGCPMIITCDVHYVDKKGGDAQNIMLLMRDKKTIADKEAGEGGWQFDAKDLYWRTLEDVARCWKKYHSDYMPKDVFLQAVRNTYDLADSIENWDFDTSLKLPGLFDNPDHILKEAVKRGIRWRSDHGYFKLSGKSNRDYVDRAKRELDVISKKGFSEYFLVVKDITDHAREVGATVGCGRGCLEGNVRIVMKNGTTKKISEIKVGEEVVSHTGIARKVTEVLSYPVDEELITLHCFCGDGKGVTLTKDHRVLTEKGTPPGTRGSLDGSTKKVQKIPNEPKGVLDWAQAKDIKEGDWVFVPTPSITSKIIKRFDMANYCDMSTVVCDEYITERVRKRKGFKFSKRDVSKATGISRNCIMSICCRMIPKKKNSRHDRAFDLVTKYVCTKFSTIDAWIDWANSYNPIEEIRQNRFIQLDNDFTKFIGLWVANGWLSSSKDRMIGIAFHEDAEEVTWIAKFIKDKIGIVPRIIHSKTSKLIQVVMYSSSFANFMRHLMTGYSYRAQTKKFPEFCKKLDNELMCSLINGYLLGDGHFGKSKITASTTSRELADQLRFFCFILGIPSGLCYSERIDNRPDMGFNGIYSSFSINIPNNVSIGGSGIKSIHNWRKIDGGILLRVRSSKIVMDIDRVYDLTVDIDHSYQTSSFAVHNSACGSIISYLLRITDIDPLRFNLLFERFLAVDRIDAPDIDLDFSPEHRPLIKDYIQERYPATASIGTFSKFKPRAILRDVGRVFGIDHKEMMLVTKQLDTDADDKTWDEIFESCPVVEQWTKKYPEAFSVVESLRGLISHRGKNAAGVLIAPESALSDLPMIIERDKNGKETVVTAFPDAQEDRQTGAGREISRLGYLKMDILGVQGLSIAPKALEIVTREHSETFDLERIPLDDETALDLASKGDVPGIFQFDSSTTRPILRHVGVDSFMDLVMITALARPGPLKHQIHKLFAKLKKTGDAWKEDIIPELVPLLEASRGLMILQEDVMFVVQAMGGFTFPEANAIRKIMAKKLDPEKLNEWERKFIEGGISKGHDRELLETIFDKVKTFSKYGFNKCVSHDTQVLVIRRKVWDIPNNRNAKDNDVDTASLSRLGVVVEIKDVMPGDMVRAIDGEWTEVVMNHNNGVKTCYQATFRSQHDGVYQVTCTLDHRFPTECGNVRLDDLTINDKLTVTNKFGHNIPVTIVDIKPVGGVVTFDLEIAHPSHCYLLANGLATHNSHSVAYCMTAYRQLYMLAHYPTEYMAALMVYTDNDKKDTGGGKRLGRFINEAVKRGIQVLPPCVMSSRYEFDVEDGKIRYGLAKIKGVSNSASYIVEARPFSTLEEFIEKVNTRKVNARVVAALIDSGAMDNLPFDSSNIEFEETDDLDVRNKLRIRYMQIRKSKKDFVRNTPSKMRELERDVLGANLSWWGTNKKDRLRQAYGLITIREAKKRKKRKFDVIAEITATRVYTSKRGDMAFLIISDETGTLENFTVWVSEWKTYKKYLTKGRFAVICLERKENTNRQYGRWSYFLQKVKAGKSVLSDIAALRDIEE